MKKFFVATLLTFLLTIPCFAEWESVAAKLQKSTVIVLADSRVGTGFFVDSNGMFVTCNHVLQGVKDLRAAVGEDIYDVELIRVDNSQDLALCRIKDYVSEPLKINTDLKVGQSFGVMGHPLKYYYTFDVGVISNVDRHITYPTGEEVNCFQITGCINSGSSGGPIVNEQCEVIGVACAVNQNMGFALFAKNVKRFVERR